MRCTACDFKVAVFAEHRWKDDTDYLFLRNNFPDFGKLKPNLISSKGISDSINQSILGDDNYCSILYINNKYIIEIGNDNVIYYILYYPSVASYLIGFPSLNRMEFVRLPMLLEGCR